MSSISLKDFDDRFVDVDFIREQKRLTVDYRQRGYLRNHEVFFSGNLGDPRPRACANFGDRVAVIPKQDWQKIAEKIEAAGGGAEDLVTRIYNQKSEGSCVANAAGQAHETMQGLQFGKEQVTHLSAISLYKQIGRSAGSGAMVSDGLDVGAKLGILPLNDEANIKRFGQNVMPNTGFSTSYPSAWKDVAKEFRFTEWDKITSVEQMATALLNQFPVCVGRQGHSICYLKLVFKDGKMYALYANSWGDWGSGAGDFDKGFGLDSESQLKMSSGWAYCPRAITVPTHIKPTLKTP